MRISATKLPFFNRNSDPNYPKILEYCAFPKIKVINNNKSTLDYKTSIYFILFKSRAVLNYHYMGYIYN